MNKIVGHLSLGVAELERARRFYDACLAPLGVVRVWDVPGGAGYGPPGGEDQLAIFEVAAPATGAGFHLALIAPSEEAVRAFWQAALLAGGRDEGPPGPRPRYGPDYFAAFVRDPDGHKLEAKLERNPG